MDNKNLILILLLSITILIITIIANVFEVGNASGHFAVITVLSCVTAATAITEMRKK